MNNKTFVSLVILVTIIVVSVLTVEVFSYIVKLVKYDKYEAAKLYLSKLVEHDIRELESIGRMSEEIFYDLIMEQLEFYNSSLPDIQPFMMVHHIGLDEKLYDDVVYNSHYNLKLFDLYNNAELRGLIEDYTDRHAEITISDGKQSEKYFIHLNYVSVPDDSIYLLIIGSSYSASNITIHRYLLQVISILLFTSIVGVSISIAVLTNYVVVMKGMLKKYQQIL